MTEAVVETAGDSDSLSPAEEAFFTSRGEKAEGLTEQKPEPKEPAKEGVQQAAESPKEARAEGDDLEAEETVEVENKGRFVRHGAFHKERMQRKALEAERAALAQRLAEREQAFARADERLKLLNEAMTPRQEQAADQPPDPEQDIFGYVRWQAKQIEALKGKTGEVAKATQEQQDEHRIRNAYLADAQAFAAKQADFKDAYAFLLQGRDAELQAYGISDPQERARLIADEERGLVQRAMQDKVSPSERVYSLAKARGYAGPKPPEPKPEPAKAQEQIDTIARGQAASKTLSSAGGSPTEVLTAEALANMSEEEFAAHLAKLPRSQQRALMGG